MRLAHAPQDIGLGAVVRGMEPDFALVECFTTGNHCTLTGHCRLTRVLQGGLASFLDYLDKFTLADLLLESGPPLPMPMVWAAPVQARADQKL